MTVRCVGCFVPALPTRTCLPLHARTGSARTVGWVLVGSKPRFLRCTTAGLHFLPLRCVQHTLLPVPFTQHLPRIPCGSRTAVRTPPHLPLLPTPAVCRAAHRLPCCTPAPTRITCCVVYLPHTCLYQVVWFYLVLPAVLHSSRCTAARLRAHRRLFATRLRAGVRSVRAFYAFNAPYTYRFAPGSAGCSYTHLCCAHTHTGFLYRATPVVPAWFTLLDAG